MNNSTIFTQKKTLMALAVAAVLGLSACKKPDGQMSDSAAADAPKESATLGAALDDTGITAKIKQRLASDERVKASEISVETNNGVVTLSGSVPSAEAKATAEELARNVPEVQGIDNQIVAPSMLDGAAAKAEDSMEKAGDKISDAAITTKIKAQMAADSQVSALDIKVNTEAGVVSLKGSVASNDIRDKAVAIARKVDGVKSVDSDGLKVAG